MIRYRTRDITALTSEPCACGRTLRRIKRIGRRSDDMFIIRGVNVYPSQIETALLKVEGTLPHYQIILTREKGLDEMEVQVEVTPEVFGDTMGALEQLQARLSQVHRDHPGPASETCGWSSRTPSSAARARPNASLTSATCERDRYETQATLPLPGKQARRSQRPGQNPGRGRDQHPDAPIAETQQFGILRLIVRDWQKAKSLLEKGGLRRQGHRRGRHRSGRPPGRSGGDAASRWKQAGINLEYMYAFTLKRESKGLLVFRFDDPDKAIAALQQRQINVVGNAELFKRLEG